MKGEWRQFWTYARRYVPLGFVISLIPFALNFSYWKAQDALLKGFTISLIFWLSLSFTIAGAFATFFGIISAAQRRTGFRFQRRLWSEIVLVLVSGFAGIYLALYVESLVFRHEFHASAIFPALIFSGFIALFLFLHMAYLHAKEEALALRAAAAESRYQTLEHQMRPHFLFNALNSLAELIESKHESAVEVTYLLSDLYRQILANSKVKTAPIGSELDIVRRYLELEKLRFGSRLSYSINLNGEEGENLYLPSLMLQTLVENAVKHGIAKSVNGGVIDIEISKTPNQLYHLKVKNSGAPIGREKHTGTGLENTRARLELLYPNKHQFRMAAEGDRTVAAFYFTGEKID